MYKKLILNRKRSPVSNFQCTYNKTLVEANYQREYILNYFTKNPNITWNSHTLSKEKASSLQKLTRTAYVL